MKVICINEKLETDFDKLPALEFGRIYTVIRETKYLSWEFYMFSELSVVGYNCWYCKDNFAPLSNIDEMELIEQREELLQSL